MLLEGSEQNCGWLQQKEDATSAGRGEGLEASTDWGWDELLT